MLKVFIVPFHVKRLENSIMPPEIGGAYVTCYSQGDTYVEAVENILKKWLKMDFTLKKFLSLFMRWMLVYGIATLKNGGRTILIIHLVSLTL